ncbi:MAG: DUF5107 domain-containing protein [Clostridia bacterium]|nr:DUF5107 domain-containing protein [Clostridia bacterium]
MDKVIISDEIRNIPTYPTKKPNVLPMIFENKPYQGASGKLYPITYSDGITDEKKDLPYRVITIENEYVKTEILPQIGGKVLTGFDKKNNYHFIYHNEVIKPALVGLAGAWISGGIEFNWPQHHRPTTFMPLECVTERNDDGSVTVWTGEVEPMNRMKGMAGITIEPGKSYIKAKVRLYNRTARPLPFMWWANLAAPANKDYRTIFPPDVEWVNDHDRRAVLSWPIAKGLYKTARPFDFGDGKDISYFSEIKVPSSYLISQGQSDMDFVAGYDMGKELGLVAVSDHYIAPGKKMWHWGDGDFGRMWCSNLTDENGPYIELMTGVYTDNQPDFTWIAPYESREFEQYWYPIHGIGSVVNATKDFAINMEKHGESVSVGINSTGTFDKAIVKLCDKSNVLLEETVDFTPESVYKKEISFEGKYEDLNFSITGNDEKTLISYKPVVRGNKKPINVREPVKRPRDITSVEELYLNGYHLEQYKQHNYKPEDYYMEGLRRDPYDIRCNTSMARLSFGIADYNKCIEYAEKAIIRLTMRNQHPTDTEAYYLKALSLQRIGKEKESYDTFAIAGWNYTHRSASYYQMALADIKYGNYEEAEEKLKTSLGLNSGHLKARNMLAVVRRITGKRGAESEAEANYEYDKLDLFAIIELSHYRDMNDIIDGFSVKSENLIDVAIDYSSCGLYEDALYALSFDKGNSPLLKYYRAYLKNITGKDYSTDLIEGNTADTGVCFPSRSEDIRVLEFVKNNSDSANPCYYLGCLYYNFQRYSDAKAEFECAIKRDPKHAKALRTLSLLSFDHFSEKEKALCYMQRAFENLQDPRLFMEYQQLMKNCDFEPQRRIEFYYSNTDLLKERDDCMIDLITLECETGNYEKAISLAKNKRFHIYEGGEGKLTKLHGWMFLLYGLKLMKEGKTDEAEMAFNSALDVPKYYGEAKTFFNQEAHINYYLGLIAQSKGEDPSELFIKASEYKAAVSEISAFRALALFRLGKTEEGNAVIEEMIRSGQNLIDNCDLRSYYGVGSPSPMPFENDIVKNNMTDGHILLGYAYLAKGKYETSIKEIKEAERYNKYDFRIYCYKTLKDTL